MNEIVFVEIKARLYRLTVNVNDSVNRLHVRILTIYLSIYLLFLKRRREKLPSELERRTVTFYRRSGIGRPEGDALG